MKRKRLLSIVLSLALIVTMMPLMSQTSHARAKVLYVGLESTPVHEEGSGNGWSYVPGSDETPSVLTLSGVNITDGEQQYDEKYGIYYEGTNELKIVLQSGSDNQVGAGDALTCGVRSAGNLIIEGEGKLTAVGETEGIYSLGGLTIGSGSVSASGQKEGAGISAVNGITINGGTVNAEGAGTGLYGGSATISITGGEVIATGQQDGSYGITANIVNIGGQPALTATGMEGAIYGSVRNDIAGNGWTNVEGSGEATPIAVNTGEEGQNLSAYKKVQFGIEPEPASVVKTVTGKTLTYNGKAQVGVAAGTGYQLSGTVKATKAGSYTATASLKEGYVWSDGSTAAKTIRWTIKKAANPLKIKAKTAKIKGCTKGKNGKLKKNKKLAAKKLIRFTKKGQGKLSYKKVSVTYSKPKSVKMSKKALKKYKKQAAKKITVNKKTGKVTLKKGLRKGTYKVKVKVKAAGNANYKASAWKKVTFKIKVK